MSSWLADAGVSGMAFARSGTMTSGFRRDARSGVNSFVGSPGIRAGSMSDGLGPSFGLGLEAGLFDAFLGPTPLLEAAAAVAGSSGGGLGGDCTWVVTGDCCR